MRISKRLSNCYINCLPRQPRRQFENELVAMVKNGNLTRQQAVEAMMSKVQDLEDTVNIQYME